MPGVPLHRLGRRRRVRRIRHRPSRFRAPPAERLQRQRAGAAAVRGHHRLPLAAARRAAAGRTAGSLRLRRQRPHHRAGRAGAGRRGARDDPRSRGARTGVANSAPRRHKAPPIRRRCRWTPRSCSRPSAIWCCPRWRRWTAAARWRSPGIHLVRHPDAELSASPVPGAPGPVGDVQHPGRRAGVPRLRRRASHRGDHAGIPAGTSRSRR